MIEPAVLPKLVAMAAIEDAILAALMALAATRAVAADLADEAFAVAADRADPEVDPDRVATP